MPSMIQRMHANRTNTALTAIVSRDETQRFSELVSMTETGDILGFTETFESELDRAKALTESDQRLQSEVE